MIKDRLMAGTGGVPRDSKLDDGNRCKIGIRGKFSIT